jgi:predicted dehydrogenase
MKEKKNLRFGVIGTGEFAQVCHVPGLQSHPQAEVVALCGSDYQRVRTIANRLGVPDVHTDYVELCSRNDLDAVTIATPNVFHARQAVAALHHKKHVLCEKPLALNVEQAEEMLHAAESSGKVHQVAFTFRYGYAVRELRRRIQSGDIGQPHYLRVQYDSWKGLLPDWEVGWREKQDLAGGGMVYDLGAHLFDVARFVLGPIKIATGFLQNFHRLRTHCFTRELAPVETDDIAAAWFRHESGVRGQWFISRVTPPYTENGWLEVIGTEGALKAALSRGKVDKLKVSSPAQPDWEELPLTEEARDEKPHCLGLMMQSFVDACLRGELDKNSDASFVDGVATQQAIAAVMEANEHLTWVPLRSRAGRRVPCRES